MEAQCTQCKFALDESAVVCPQCGTAVGEQAGSASELQSSPAEGAVLPPEQPAGLLDAAIEPPAFRVDNDLEGIGGWLILPAIGLALSPFMSVHGIYTDLHILFSRSYETYLASHRGLGGLILFEAVNNSVFLMAGIYLNYLLYTKKRLFPMGMIAFYAGSFVLMLADHLMAARYLPNTEWTTVARIGITCVVWIPYFLNSQRVEQTFVK